MKKLFLLFLVAIIFLWSRASFSEERSGKEIYNYYCYQCHGYSGDAATLSTTFLTPPPRNFRQTLKGDLSQQEMVLAVTEGRANTGMVSFKRVLSPAEINAVVNFIRDAFMSDLPLDQRYHSDINGWPNHEKYQSAYPFAAGEIAIDVPWEQLTKQQQAGKKLFMQSCISCHDRANVREEGDIWQHQAVSYPRSGKYDPEQPKVYDAMTGATNFMLHEIKPNLINPSPIELQGEQLFQENCAFCHGADATGKNWIGVFMQPKAANLRQSTLVNNMDSTALKQVIANGIENTSMPAWRGVLSTEGVNAIVNYLHAISSTKLQADKPHSQERTTSNNKATVIWKKTGNSLDYRQ